MEFRHMKKSDLAMYGELNRYCFRDIDTPEHRDRYMGIISHHLDHTWGAFDRGVMHAGLWYYPYQMQMDGVFLPMGGVAAVVSRPESRNNGLVRDLMTRMHQQMRAEKRPLSVLMPFKNSFYGRMGYADTFFIHEHVFEPHQLARRPVGPYTLREVDGTKNWQTLEQLRLEWSTHYTGTVRRDARYWQSRLIDTWRGQRHTYLVERRQGGGKRSKGAEVTGYLIANLFPTMERADLRVVQAIWQDPGTLDAILQFLRGLRDQVKEVRWFLPIDVDLFPFFEDPKIKVTYWPKMMFKLVDLKTAIELRKYDADFKGELLLDITADETSTWNAGKWRINWHDGTARVSKLTRGVPRASLVKIDIQTLGIIYSGHRSASALAKVGLLSASMPALTILDRMFPSGIPHMEEWF